MLMALAHGNSATHTPFSGGTVPAATILLLDANAADADLIGGILTGVGYSVTTLPDADEAFGRIADHQLVVLDIIAGPKSATEVCAEIRATPSMASIPVLCVCQSDDVEERIRFLEAGADDVVAKPFDARELEARVEALLLRFQRSKDLAAVVSPDGVTMTTPRRMVAVYSPKGGVGTTTIDTNVAVIAAATRPGRVALVDLDLQFGSVATHLNLEAKQTLADVARDSAALREPELLRSYTVKHSSGLHVICGPPTPELAELVTTEAVEQLLGTLHDAYDQVVIDAGSILDERTMLVLEAAETVILPVHPEIAALKAMHTLLDYLNEAGAVGAKALFVLNNAFAREILKMRDIEAALGTRIATELPYDPFLYLKAINEGVPIVLGASRSPAAERLIKLAGSAFGQDGVTAPSPVTEHRGLFGALRRKA
jgi:pilus assembly protein CpaE